MNILNDQVFVKIKAWPSLVALATKASTQPAYAETSAGRRRDWQKDGFKMFRKLLHDVLTLVLVKSFLILDKSCFLISNSHCSYFLAIFRYLKLLSYRTSKSSFA
jgi:hypothetical protein